MARKSFYTLLSICLFLGALLYPAQPAARAQVSSGANSREERIRVFDQVWRAIFDNYYDRQFRGVDWRLQREVFRPQAEAARSSLELYRVLRQMIGKLGDAHTRIYAPEDGFDRHRPAGTTVGVVVRRIEGKAVVTWVEPGSEAARQGIRSGFMVSQVDGVPVEKKIERIREEIGESSTQTALELQSYDKLFYGPRDAPLAVTFVDREGRLRPVTLVRRFVEFQRRVIVRKLPYRIGYIEVTGFGPEIEKDFEAAMQEVQGTRGLILDLRNNGGGFVTTVSNIASYFFPEEVNLGEFITRQGRATPRNTQRLRTLYREPLIVLVSARSASGSEILAAAMQERKRALVVGTNPTTCGCLLGVSRTLRLSDGGKLNVSDTDYRTARGRRIEGSGVKPDLQFEVRIADLLAGRDRPLEFAVEQLGRTIAFGPRNAEIEFKLNVPHISSRSPIRNSPTSQLRQ
jgi:carboxyl-terminal processing protease